MKIRIILFLSLLLLLMSVPLNYAAKNNKFGFFDRFSLLRSIFGRNKHNNNKNDNKRVSKSRKFHFMRLYDSIKKLLNRKNNNFINHNINNNDNFIMIPPESIITNVKNDIINEDNIEIDNIIENLEALRSTTIENIDTLICENCEDSNQIMLGRKEKPSSWFGFIDFNLMNFRSNTPINNNNNGEPRRITDGREYDFTYFYTLLLVGMVGWYVTSKDHEAIRQRQHDILNEAVVKSLQSKGIHVEPVVKEIEEEEEEEEEMEVVEGIAVVQENEKEIENKIQDEIQNESQDNSDSEMERPVSVPSSPSRSSGAVASSNITPVIIKTKIKLETPVQQEHQVEVEKVKVEEVIQPNSSLAKEINLVLEEVPIDSPLPPFVRPVTASPSRQGSTNSTLQTSTNTNTQTIPMTLTPGLRSPSLSSPSSSGSSFITTPTTASSNKSIDDVNGSLGEFSMIHSPMGIGSPYDGLSSDSSGVQSPEGESLSAYKRKLQGMAGALAGTMDMRAERDQSRDFDLDDLESMLLYGATTTSSASKNLTHRNSSDSQSPNAKLGGDGRVYNSLGNASYKEGHYEHALQYYEMARAILSEGEGEEKQVDQKFMECITTNIDLSMKKILEKACNGSPNARNSDGDDDVIITAVTAPVTGHVSISKDAKLVKPSPRRISPDSIVGMWA